MGQIDVTESLWTDNERLEKELSTLKHLFGGAEVKIALFERDNEQLRQQIIHHVERIGKQSEIITKLTEGAKARNKMVEELTELLKEYLDSYRDELECRLDHNGWCQAHDCDNQCLVWRIKQVLRE